ncbi:MAG: class I SAM-dependent methyltransferase [Pseudomonadota bacterium]
MFEREGKLYRQINESYAADYERLTASGLYDALVNRGWLIPHEECEEPGDGWRVIAPERIPYVSYPYEWCFSQLRDAALLTLDIQLLALDHGMTLKDASAFNVQFRGARPVFIDTLSFAQLDAEAPWIAYRQYCQHFLAPLALMSYAEPRVRKLLLGFIDGVPLDLAARLLPLRSRLRYSMLAHIHLHARSQGQHADSQGAAGGRKMSLTLLKALIQSLRSATQKCELPSRLNTEWGDYYSDTNYSIESMDDKEVLINTLVKKYAPADGTVHDLGANTGRFSRIAAQLQMQVVSHDIDELAVERNYLAGRQAQGVDHTHVLPLVLDLTNPTPALGWNASERDGFTDRCRGDVVMALALIHHLAISNNTPLGKVAEFLAPLSRTLIIEFVPKGDSQVDRLLATREDIFPDYHEQGFEAAFAPYFDLKEKQPVGGTNRTMYAFESRR